MKKKYVTPELDYIEIHMHDILSDSEEDRVKTETTPVETVDPWLQNGGLAP